eukprot:TRINITY_DN29787_c0_g1_i2.p1 TRINITY_DN29787_c0_g1~~TRINITY_DN29787_c0_g1_i2.p1  ORF type:complete len:290 (-),score=31.60 TRINITY_DN29787_c0_g1_i2:502-1371(-)
MAHVQYQACHFTKALAYAQKAQSIAGVSQDERAIGSAIVNVACCMAMMGRYGSGADLGIKALHRLRRLQGVEGSEAGIAICLHNIGVCNLQLYQIGKLPHPAAAVESMVEADRIARQVLPAGHPWRVAVALALKATIKDNLTMSLLDGRPLLPPRTSKKIKFSARKPKRPNTHQGSGQPHPAQLAGVGGRVHHLDLRTEIPPSPTSSSFSQRTFGTRPPSQTGSSLSHRTRRQITDLDPTLQALVLKRRSQQKVQGGADPWIGDGSNPEDLDLRIQNQDLQSCSPLGLP